MDPEMNQAFDDVAGSRTILGGAPEVQPIERGRHATLAPAAAPTYAPR